MEQTKNQRLKIFLDQERIKSKDFAIAMESTPQYASSLINGGSALGPKVVDKITTIYPNLSKAWLAYGEGEMYVNKSTKKEDESTKISYAAFKHLEEEVLYLREMLKMAMGNMANFQNSPLQAAKLHTLKGALAGDYKLAA